jgi:DnaK suppressor protein
MVGRRVCHHVQMTTDPSEVLAAKRRQLHEQLAEMSAPPAELGNISFGKRVGEGTSQAVDRMSAVPAHDKLQLLLAEIQRAEEKVAEGSYGRCDICHQDIGAARLEARPWATRCLEHAT